MQHGVASLLERMETAGWVERRRHERDRRAYRIRLKPGGKRKYEELRDIGKLVAERAVSKGLSEVVFDRGSYLFHGRVKALAEAAREAGLKF